MNLTTEGVKVLNRPFAGSATPGLVKPFKKSKEFGTILSTNVLFTTP